MGKPFQFSIRRMLAAMALFCADACLIGAIRRIVLFDQLLLTAIAVVAAGSIMGGAIGCLIRKPLVAASIGALAGVVVFVVILVWAMTSADI